MKVLVAYGSKYGATGEIAQKLADILTESGHEAVAEHAYDVLDVSAYDAFVVGSAVYGGFWRRDASALLAEFAAPMKHKPLWLFSCGLAEGRQIRGVRNGEGFSLAEKYGARDHAYFKGALDYDKLNMGETALIRGLNVDSGDYRSWEEIERWAIAVVAQLTAEANAA